jgi:hypothetical protein
VNWQSREDERVARALEGAPLHGREDRAVVALAERIREVPAEALDATPAFRDALRARLLAEGATLLPRPRTPSEGDEPVPGSPADDRRATGPGRSRPARQGPPARRPTRSGRRRRRLAAGTLVVATLSAGTVAASAGALPGDPLYGLKRQVQNVEVALARGDEDRGQQHLRLARSRVRELDTAGVSARSGPLVAALQDMDGDTRNGARLLSTVAIRDDDESPLTELETWTQQQRTLLGAAANRLPDAARFRAATSLALLGTVTARLDTLRAALRCDCQDARPLDDLGPQPCAACLSPVAGVPRPTTVRPSPAATSAAPMGGAPTSAPVPSPHASAGGAPPSPTPPGSSGSVPSTGPAGAGPAGAGRTEPAAAPAAAGAARPGHSARRRRAVQPAPGPAAGRVGRGARRPVRHPRPGRLSRPVHPAVARRGGSRCRCPHTLSGRTGFPTPEEGGQEPCLG